MTVDEPVVYVVWLRGSRFFKIGRSTVRSLRHRVASIQHGVPTQVLLVAAVRADPFVETQLHRRYRPFRRFGEWFELPERTAFELVLAVGSEPTTAFGDLIGAS